MKVGLVSPYNMLRAGGVQECVLALQHELTARGHQALIITPQPRDYKGAPPAGVVFVGGSTDIKSIFNTTPQVSASVDITALQQLLEFECFDVLHVHEPWLPMIGRQILSRSRAVNIATFHAKLPEHIMSRTFEKVITPYTRSILKYIHAFTAVSEPAASYLKTLTNAEVAIIPNGIDLAKYRWSPASSGKKSILFIGRLEGRKGVKYLLKAFRQLTAVHPDLALRIVGDGIDRIKLERMVAQENIPGVEFLGRVDEAEKLRLLHEATLFCSPAIYGESFGIVLLEAMACGTPVIAGDNPGYRTVLRDRGQLSLVNPKDQDSFCRHLEVMLYDGAVRKLWREWARDAVQAYDYPRVVDAYEQVYQQALERQ